MSGEYSEQTVQGSLPRKRAIRARTFVAEFRECPDDFYLLLRFSITPRQLRKIYSALLARGLISEEEYNCRERKLPQLHEDERTSSAAYAAANLHKNASEAISELVYSGHQMDSSVMKALRKLQLKREFEKRRSRAEDATTELCPKCHNPKDSSSPDTCLYCGIVFAKIESGKHYGEVTLRRAG